MVQQLLEGMPPGVIELSAVPGLNLKKIIALHDALGIESIADLKTACQEGLVSKVKGFGLKSQAKLLSDIESLQIPKDGSLLLSHALETAERILKHLRAAPELIEADLAGALRRRKETVRRISSSPPAINRGRSSIDFCASRHWRIPMNWMKPDALRAWQGVCESN